nr:MAG TPA: hypothetical protein [Caudoviricetes sp.]
MHSELPVVPNRRRKTTQRLGTVSWLALPLFPNHSTAVHSSSAAAVKKILLTILFNQSIHQYIGV